MDSGPLARGGLIPRCPLTRRPEAATRYSEWEITGPAEIRDVKRDVRYFETTPWAAAMALLPDSAP